jgi:RNA polymerase sigma factor (sigma-70 family)
MDERQRFQEVVLPHLDDALSLARWLTGNVTDAEDVVQDACLRAYRAMASVRDGNPRAWLLAIVRNAAFTWLAKNRPNTLLVTSDDDVFERARTGMTDPTARATPEAALIAKADNEQLHRAIAALPVVFREVLVLRELEEMSYKDIANILSVPAGTVMSRLARARALLISNIGQSSADKTGAT